MDACFSCFCYTSTPCFDYETAVKYIKTGDLLYFCNFNSWTSYFTILFGAKLVTHVAVAVQMPDGEIGAFESVYHSEDQCDLLLKNRLVHSGVRLVSLRRKLKIQASVSRWMYVQPLRVSEVTRTGFPELLSAFMRSVDCLPYEENLVCMCTAPLFGSPGHPTGHRARDSRSYYCSELCAAAYQKMGLIDNKINPQTVWHTAFLNCEIPLLGGAYLESNGYYVRPPLRRIKNYPFHICSHTQLRIPISLLENV